LNPDDQAGVIPRPNAIISFVSLLSVGWMVGKLHPCTFPLNNKENGDSNNEIPVIFKYNIMKIKSVINPCKNTDI
jgi:hypothetical protein